MGLVVRSPSFERVGRLLGDYVERFTEEFLAVLPPLERTDRA